METRPTGLPADPAAYPAFAVGGWRVEPSLNRIAGRGRTHQVRPRVMHVLVCLASRDGGVVRREEFMDTVWADAVVGDEGLTVAVSELRQLLGDDPQAPRLIETIRKGGYRLIAPVTPASTPAGAATRRSGPRTGHLVPLALVLILVAMLVWQRTGRRAARGPMLVGRPLTSYASSEVFPAFAPDGDRVAFCWSGDPPEDLEIYVRQVSGPALLRLTELPGADLLPAWSPDGTRIAFVHLEPDPGIHVVPSLGGPARRIWGDGRPATGLDWTADGSALLVSVAGTGARPAQLLRLDPVGEEPAEVLATGGELAALSAVRCAPRGDGAACVGTDGAGLQDVFLLPRPGAELRRLTRLGGHVRGLSWAEGGGSLILAAATTGDHQLWRLDLADARLSWLPTRDQAAFPHVSPRGRRLVYEAHVHDSDVWRLDLRGGPGSGAQPERLVASTRDDRLASPSPDGRRIAFVSCRSGRPEVWLCDRDGGEPRQLTRLAGGPVTRPCWAPDGRRLAFSTVVDGIAAAHVIDVPGEPPRRVHDTPRHELVAAWPPDGNWLHVVAMTAEGPRLRRLRPDGTEDAPLVAEATAWIGLAPGDTAILGARHGATGLWSFPLRGGPPRPVFPDLALEDCSAATAGPRGLYYFQLTPAGHALQHRDFTTGRVDTLALVPPFGCENLSLAPDGSCLLFDRSDRFDCDLVLVEDWTRGGG